MGREYIVEGYYTITAETVSQWDEDYHELRDFTSYGDDEAQAMAITWDAAADILKGMEEQGAVNAYVGTSVTKKGWRDDSV